MRRSFLFAALVFFALGALAAACGGDDDDTADFPTEVQITDEDNGSSVQLALDGELIVSLASNPSTGYSWFVGEDSDAALALQGDPEYVPPTSATPLVGAGGTEVFTFKAESSGTASLVLEYKRPFEPDEPPEQTFSVTVEIR